MLLIISLQILLAFGDLKTVYSHEDSSSLDMRILHGRVTDSNEFPYFVGMCFSEPERYGYCFLCGGALLDHQWVLTAGHCIRGTPETTLAYLGLEKYSYSSLTNESYVKVSKFVLHEKYTPLPKTSYDIALIKLSQPVEFSNKIKPIKLWPMPVPPGAIITVVGRGQTYNTTQTELLELMTVDLRVLANNKCEINPDFIPEQMFCALGTNKKSTCQGDSGGPATFGTGDDVRHVGVISFGTTICDKGQPEYYTRTSQFIDWIENVMKSG